MLCFIIVHSSPILFNCFCNSRMLNTFLVSSYHAAYSPWDRDWETKHDIYMKVWGAYRRSYNKVKKEYDYINNGKDVFKSYKEFKKHLEKHNIADSPSDDMIFHLYCGKVYITINTSYLKFSNIFEQIKFALKDYKFKYNIEAKNE